VGEPATDTARLELIARDSLSAYGVPTGAELTLLNISENATYRVDDPVTGERSVLRVNRPGYHSPDAIRSELAWVQALRADGVVSTPAVLPALDGSPVAAGTHPDGERRNVVRFAWVDGVEPAGARLVDDFRALGAITARLHRHARNWRRPTGFTRFRWDYETSIGPRGHWGRWQDGMAVGAAEHAVLGRLDALLRDRLAAFGDGPDRFGLVHADMRLANLLVDPATDGAPDAGLPAGDPDPGAAGAGLPAGRSSGVNVIDFDDCGFGWYLYDLGSSLSFIEHDPQVPALIDAWVSGYREVAPLSAAEEAELPTFVLLRRLLLVAWIGSHHDTELAQEMGAEFTRVSCDLAEDYLSRFTRPHP
jgi:Ser/Thr protein kinase RdoA (MazF antagonist)